MKVRLKYALMGEIEVEMTPEQFAKIDDDAHGLPMSEDDLVDCLGAPFASDGQLDPWKLTEGVHEIEFMEAEEVRPKGGKPRKLKSPTATNIGKRRDKSAGP